MNDDDEIVRIKKLLSEGKIDKAKRELLLMTGSEPNRRDVWMFLATIAARAEDFQGSLVPFQNLIRLNPTSSIASSGYAQACYKCGLSDEALHEISRFRELAEKSDPSVRRVLEEHNKIEQELQ